MNGRGDTGGKRSWKRERETRAMNEPFFGMDVDLREKLFDLINHLSCGVCDADMTFRAVSFGSKGSCHNGNSML